MQETQIGAYRLQKKAIFILSMYVTHRHPDFWDNPSEYQPERFLHRNNKGFAFFPYGGGRITKILFIKEYTT